MKRSELLYKLTGTETPMFLTERENVMIDKFMEIINEPKNSPQTHGFTEPKGKVSDLSAELTKAFEDLTYRLSPENLACDGEISNTEVQRRYLAIKREWRALEKQAGRKVSEQEFYY